MAARRETINTLNRLRTLTYLMFHEECCCPKKGCGKQFTNDDIRTANIMVDHKSKDRSDNSRRNQRYMHPSCHKSYTMKYRQRELQEAKRLVRLGLKKPGKTRFVPKATPWGG